MLCFSFLLRDTFSASHPTSSKNKVRVYWLNLRRVKITEQRLKAGAVDWACWGGSMQFSPTLRGLWSQPYSPSFTGLSTNVSHLAHCNLSESALLKQQDRGEERACWIFWHNPSLSLPQITRVWTKTVTVVYFRTDATISQAEKEMNKKGLKYVQGPRHSQENEYLLTVISIDNSQGHYTSSGLGAPALRVTPPLLKMCDTTTHSTHRKERRWI